MRLSAISIFIIFALSPLFGADGKADLSVTVTGLRITGIVQIYLYSSDDGFPTKPEKAMAVKRELADKAEITVKFEGIPYGEYAVAIMHDENGNGKVDTNWIGIPIEGLGVSNNAKGFMGPPKFKDAKVMIDTPVKKLSIPVKYRN